MASRLKELERLHKADAALRACSERCEQPDVQLSPDRCAHLPHTYPRERMFPTMLAMKGSTMQAGILAHVMPALLFANVDTHFQDNPCSDLIGSSDSLMAGLREKLYQHFVPEVEASEVDRVDVSTFLQESAACAGAACSQCSNRSRHLRMKFISNRARGSAVSELLGDNAWVTLSDCIRDIRFVLCSLDEIDKLTPRELEDWQRENSSDADDDTWMFDRDFVEDGRLQR